MATLVDFLIVGAVAAVVTALLTPVSRVIAIRVGAVAQPDARKVHEKATPSLGGLAMFGGIAAGLLTAWAMGTFDPVFRSITDIAGIVIAGLIIFLVGATDDILSLIHISEPRDRQKSRMPSSA